MLSTLAQSCAQIRLTTHLCFACQELTRSKVHAHISSAAQTDRCTHSTLRKARLHLDALWWTAGAETSEREIYLRACCVRSSRLPSLPQASRSYAPFAPTASTRSLLMPTEQGRATPGHDGMLRTL